MASREIVITLDSPAFRKIMMEAFEKAGRTTIERMGELAENDAEREIVARLGSQCLAELEE